MATFGWLVNFAVNSVFLTVLDDDDGRWVIFLVLGAFALLAWLFVFFFVPETINKEIKTNLEELIGEEKLRDARRELRERWGIKDVDANSKSKVMKDGVTFKQNAYKSQIQY